MYGGFYYFYSVISVCTILKKNFIGRYLFSFSFSFQRVCLILLLSNIWDFMPPRCSEMAFPASFHKKQKTDFDWKFTVSLKSGSANFLRAWNQAEPEPFTSLQFKLNGLSFTKCTDHFLMALIVKENYEFRRKLHVQSLSGNEFHWFY